MRGLTFILVIHISLFLDLLAVSSLYIVINILNLLDLCFIRFSLDLNHHLHIEIELFIFYRMYVLCNHTSLLHLRSILSIFFAYILYLPSSLLYLLYLIDHPLYEKRIMLLSTLKKNYFWQILLLMVFKLISRNEVMIFM